MSEKSGSLEGLPTSDLLQRYCRDGDARAFEVAYARCVPHLRGLVRRMTAGRLAGRVAVEDVLQDISMKAQRNLRTFRYEKPHALLKWLKKITVNHIRDLAKKKANTKERSTSLENTGKRLRDPDLTPCTRACINDEVRKIMEVVEGFSRINQAIFALHFLQGLTLEETGARLDMPQQTVWDHKMRMCGVIRRRLEGPGENGGSGGSTPAGG